MSDMVFSLRLEWVLYCLALLVILPITITNILQGNYNPSPVKAWCFAQPYPYDCEGDGCTRGVKMLERKPYFIVPGMIIITVLCLGLTVLHVYQKDRASIDAAPARAQATTAANNDDCEIASNNAPSSSSSEVDEDEVSSNGEVTNEDSSAVLLVNQWEQRYKWTSIKEAFSDEPSQVTANSAGFASNAASYDSGKEDKSFPDTLSQLLPDTVGFASSAASFDSGKEDESDKDEDRDSTPERTIYVDIIIPSCAGEDKEESPGINQKVQHYEETKFIIKQAFAYASVNIIMVALGGTTDLFITSVPFGVIHAIIRPSHGTLNMIIFLYLKYFNLRKNHQLLTCYEVLGKLFRGESDEHEIIVDTMAPVIHYNAAAERRKNLYVIDEESSDFDSIE